MPGVSQEPQSADLDADFAAKMAGARNQALLGDAPVKLQGVQSSWVLYLMLGRTLVLSRNRNYWRGFVVFSLLDGILFRVPDACCFKFGLPSAQWDGSVRDCGFVDFLLTALDGTPLFRLPVERLAVSPELCKDARRFQGCGWRNVLSGCPEDVRLVSTCEAKGPGWRWKGTMGPICYTQQRPWSKCCPSRSRCSSGGQDGWYQKSGPTRCA